jgi:competence protein ComEC
VLAVALSFICGIATYRFLPYFPFSLPMLFVISFLLLYRYNKRKALIITTVFIFGLLYTSIRHEPPQDIKLPDGEVQLTGTIIDVPEISDDALRFTIGDVEIEGVRINGRIILFLDLAKNEQYFIPISGNRISAIVRLRKTGGFRNPGVYLYDPRRRGIVASGGVLSLRITGSTRGIRETINRKRQRLGWITKRSLSPQSTSLLNAIIPGLKRGIDPEMRDNFSSTGLAHLLSISGTHFGLLAFFLFKMVRITVRLLPLKILNRLTLYVTPSQISILLTMPVLLLYAGISGTSTPTIRSLIMISIFMIALFIGRRDQWLNSLSIAAIIILLWNPSALFEVSFLLSFIAVLSIGLVLERVNTIYEEIEGVRERMLRRLKTAFLITLSAVFGTAPFVILFFKQFPLISPITNLLITPLVCFIILPLGFFSGFTALFLDITSLPLNHLIDLITGFIINLVNLFSDIPYASIHLHNPSFLLIVVYYLSMALIITRKGWGRFLPVCAVIVLFLLRPYIHNYDMKIAFLDVGQGDSSVIELPDRKVMLIDGGSEGNNAGRRVVAPYLWAKGIRDIDILVLSHPHYDHYGGLLYILDNMDVKEVWLNGRYADGSETFFQKLGKKKIPYRILKRGDSFETDDYRVIVLHPYNGFYADSERGSFSDENSDSLVLKIVRNNLSILFTGDIESEAEENIIHLDGWLKSDIIKVPHHGGRTSSIEDFIMAVDPDVAVISAGRYNSFGHPHSETIGRYKQKGVRLYRTDRDGAVIALINDNGYIIKTYEDLSIKKVHSLRDEIHNLMLLL